MKSSNRMVCLPKRSYFLIRMLTKVSERRYPKEDRAVFSSSRSIFPELSLSNDRKQFCQSVTYFQSAPKSWKLTVPRFSRSNIPNLKFEGLECDYLSLTKCFEQFNLYLPIINRTVSGLNGSHVPFDNACCSSSAEMQPLRSLSTLKRRKN